MPTLILIDYNELWTNTYEWLISIDEGGEKNELLITNDELRVTSWKLKMKTEEIWSLRNSRFDPDGIWCFAIQDLIPSRIWSRSEFQFWPQCEIDHKENLGSLTRARIIRHFVDAETLFCRFDPRWGRWIFGFWLGLQRFDPDGVHQNRVRVKSESGSLHSGFSSLLALSTRRAALNLTLQLFLVNPSTSSIFQTFGP